MLSDERIAEMMRETWGAANIAPRHAETFARAIEAEVRKQDEALIRWMLEALETAGVYPPSAQAAITTARARLSERRNAS